MYRGRFGGPDTQWSAVSLSKVQDVQVTQGPLGAYVQLSSADGAFGVMVFGQLPRKAAAGFVAAVEATREAEAPR
jgi:hypothetical protein